MREEFQARTGRSNITWKSQAHQREFTEGRMMRELICGSKSRKLQSQEKGVFPSCSQSLKGY